MVRRSRPARIASDVLPERDRAAAARWRMRSKESVAQLPPPLPVFNCDKNFYSSALHERARGWIARMLEGQSFRLERLLQWPNSRSREIATHALRACARRLLRTSAAATRSVRRSRSWLTDGRSPTCGADGPTR